METLKFGFKYWKRNVPGAIFTQLISFFGNHCGFDDTDAFRYFIELYYQRGHD